MGVTFNGKAATSDPLRLARAHWSLATRPSSTSVLTSISAGKFAACIGAGNCPLPEGTTKVFIFTVSFSLCFVSPLSVSIAPHVMRCFRADSRLSARPNCTRCHWHHISNRLLGCVATCVLRKCITERFRSVGSVGVAAESLFRTKEIRLFWAQVRS